MLNLKLLKKFTIAFLMAFVLVLLCSSRVHADKKMTDAISSKDMNLESFIAGKELIDPTGGAKGVLGSLIGGITGFLVGVYDENGQALNTGAAGSLVAYTSVFYNNRPVSFSRYLAYINTHKFRVVQPAYAQGEGWNFLFPIIELWEAARNIAYLFIIVVFVVIGFMIMFRSKINPQTVISIQNALPKIIIALLLITFSYAICGLIVDLAFLGNKLMTGIFGTVLEDMDRSTPFTWQETPELTRYIQTFGGTGALGLLGNALVNIGQFISGNFNAVVALVIAFSLVGSLIKIFFSLLIQYITLIFGAVLSPLVFLFGGLPGQATSKLMKMMLVAALTFPITLLLLNVAELFSSYNPNFTDLPPFSPSQILANLPQISGTFNQLVALGVIMAASQVPSVLQEAFQTKGMPGVGALGDVGGALRKIPIIGGLLG